MQFSLINIVIFVLPFWSVQGEDLPCCGVSVAATKAVDSNNTSTGAIAISDLLTVWKDNPALSEALYGPINCWDTGDVTSLQNAFKGVTGFDFGNLSCWDVSNVQNLNNAFKESSFSGTPLCSWQTTSVTNMAGTFSGVNNNFDVDCWDVSGVTTFQGTFAYSKFNSGLPSWNTGAAKTMRHMFRGTTSFDQDLSGFDTQSVTDMRQMFRESEQFQGSGLEDWNVGEVVYFDEMFYYADQFDGSLSDWTPSKARTMIRMFSHAPLFTGGDLSGWAAHLGSVEDLQEMFRHTTGFTGSVAGWNLGSCTSLSQIFYECQCDPNVDDWYVGNVQDMYRAFMGTALTADVSAWDVGSVTNFGEMFSYTSTFSSDVSQWRVDNGVTFNHMFRDTKVDSDFSGWSMSNAVSTSRMFYSNTHFTGQGLETWDVSGVTDFSYMFTGTTSFTGDTIVDWRVGSASWTTDGESCGDGRCGFYAMFQNSGLDRDLCHWLDQVEATNNESGVALPVEYMFAGSACPFQGDPDLGNPSATTMCYDCSAARRRLRRRRNA